MSTQPKTFLTPGQYLEIERAAETRSEYWNGEMFAMAGTSLPHGRIVKNLLFQLTLQLGSRECEAFPSDLRLRLDSSGLYTYPDVMVICGQPEVTDSVVDTVTNPKVIVEVLSPSTEAYDRGKKFEMYRTLGTFRDYILIAQDRVHVEHFTRQSPDVWTLHILAAAEKNLDIPSIDCSVKVADIYARVSFDPPPTTPPVSPPQS